jgi:hypothetical protein
MHLSEQVPDVGIPHGKNGRCRASRAFLGSADAEGVTGQGITVDSGLTQRALRNSQSDAEILSSTGRDGLSNLLLGRV